VQLTLLSVAATFPHAALCARFWPLSGVLTLGPITEAAHLAVHALIFGMLAAALSAWVARPAEAGISLRAGGALMYFCAVMGARQLVRLFVWRPMPGAEEALEVSFDLVAGALGAIAWALYDPSGARRVARGLGWLFHPAVIAPLGFFALCWTHEGHVVA